MKNKIVDLRDHLFETIEALKDKDHPMDIQRAKAIANAAQVIVNSVKVENEFLKLTGGKGSGFVPDDAPALPKPGEPSGRTVHRIK